MRKNEQTVYVDGSAADAGMVRADGADLEKTGAWTSAWNMLWNARMSNGKSRYANSGKWTTVVQQSFPEEVKAFDSLSDEELDATLAVLRHDKGEAFYIAACVCMMRAQRETEKP